MLGHFDPDLTEKASEGMLKSPTLSELGRMVLMQTISSYQRAGPLEPGLPKDAVIEVLGSVYGQNDAPAAWFREFNWTAVSIGWTQSKLDPCLYTLRLLE